MLGVCQVKAQFPLRSSNAKIRMGAEGGTVLGQQHNERQYSRLQRAEG